MKILFLFNLFLLLLFPAQLQAEFKIPETKPLFNFEVLRSIAILEQGRQKPLDTYARETIRFVTGREKFAGFDPMELLFSWLTQSFDWEKLPILQVGHHDLVMELNLPIVQDKNYPKAFQGRIAPKTLKRHEEFNLFLETVSNKQTQGGTLSELDRQGGLLGKRLKTFYEIAEGSSLKVLPQKKDYPGGWENLAQLSQRYPKLDTQGAMPTLEAKIAAGVQVLLSSYYQDDPKVFAEAATLLHSLLRERGKLVKNYPTQNTLQREIHFNWLKPFRLAWLGYALGFFVLLFGILVNRKTKEDDQKNEFSFWSYIPGLAIILLTFAMHGYGFVLRMLISGRAPVTNMYETVIWVPFGVVLFALILEAIYKVRYYALAASGVATLCLILADSAPSILDPAIDPLVPVLRDNFWLTIHVLTITLSYAAFALALGVANMAIGFYVFKPGLKQKIQQLNFFVYRAIQVGVVLLAAGTILGGVWANASWGRFWGWDPKEVWALIALLGYLAVLHGRYAGWIKGFGLSAGAIVCFLLVLMAWYGVNFILGVGLHSYGFSSGGATFVSVFTAVELIWIGMAALRSGSVFSFRKA